MPRAPLAFGFLKFVAEGVRHWPADAANILVVDRALVVAVMQPCGADHRVEPAFVDPVHDWLDDDPHVRGWGIQLALETGAPTDKLLEVIADLKAHVDDFVNHVGPGPGGHGGPGGPGGHGGNESGCRRLGS